MVKEYFSHDIGTINNIKINKMMFDYGYEGLGWYWTIVEEIYRADGEYYLSDIPAMANTMKVDENSLTTFIFKCAEEYTEKGKGLFIIENDILTSESIKKRIDLKKKRAAARQGNANDEDLKVFEEYEHIRLTEDDYSVLVERHGEDFVKKALSILDSWLSRGTPNARKYLNNKSHRGFFRADCWLVQQTNEALGRNTKPNWGGI